MLSGGGGGRHDLAVLLRAGVLSLGRPDRMLKQLAALKTFGPTLAGSFAAAAARNPDRTAVIDDRRRLSYGELDARVRRIAAGLADLGVGPHAAVAVLARNSAHLVEALVATARLGADALLLSTFLSPAQLTEVLARERPRAVIVDAELHPGLVDLLPDVTVIIADPGEHISTAVSLDQLAQPEPSGSKTFTGPQKPGRLIVLTSGTTGAPKGARRGAPKGLGPAASMLSRIRLRSPETMFIAPPLFHTWGLGMLQLAPAVNATIVLQRQPDAESILAAVSEHDCTSLVLVPVLAQRLLELPTAIRSRYSTAGLRAVVCSSAPIPPDLSTRFQAAFGDVLYNVYGATEVSWVTIATPEDLRLRPGTAGRPPHGTRLELLDTQGEPVPLGEIGDIHVGNELMFEGYTNGHDKHRRRGLMTIGDRGFIDGNGLLVVLGRDDDMVISGGENVYPSVVEELLIAHPKVREVAVIGVPDARLGQRLAAYIVPTPAPDPQLTAGPSSGADLHLTTGELTADELTADELTADDVRSLVRSRLATFCIPRDVVFLTELPRNATGKVVPRLLPPPPPPLP